MQLEIVRSSPESRRVGPSRKQRQEFPALIVRRCGFPEQHALFQYRCFPPMAIAVCRNRNSCGEGLRTAFEPFETAIGRGEGRVRTGSKWRITMTFLRRHASLCTSPCQAR